MKVTLLYYKINFEKETQMNLFNFPKIDTNLSIEDKIQDYINSRKPEDDLFRNDNYLFSILEISTNYIFGTYGKIEDVSEKKLTRIRSRDNLKEENINNIKDLIERYTVFYFDIKTNSCITLHNHNVNGFKTQFSKFLMQHFKLSGIYKNISVVNKINENIPETIGKLTKFSKLTYSYSSNKLPDNAFSSVKEISAFKNNQIRSANVELYFEPDKDFSKSAKLLSNTDAYIDSFDTFKIHTENITIDVVEKILSKKIDIEIEENDLDNIFIIKDKLIKNLDNY